MTSHTKQKFILDSEKITENITHRNTIRFNMGKYHAAVLNGNARYANKELARDKAASIKQHAIANLPEFLEQFEKNFTNNGGKVLWAKSSEDAVRFISNILKEHSVTSVVKSKSMTTEEIELNEALEHIGIESVETDLGEYIVQLAGEKPYHIVTPAMHKSKQDVAKLFNEKFNSPIESTPEELTGLARVNLRKKYIEAGAGITGANFIIPDIGGIAVTENEGNAIMSTAFPKIHIAIAGIEKVIPSYKDLALMWPHLAQFGTGQAITVYNSIFTGPKKANEAHGPEKMYVILLDNGRTDLFKHPHLQQSLTCIRCGACLNACPIYHNIGGYTYNTTYQGPIGSVISPHLNSFSDFSHLNNACSLCGNCTTVCPVKIPLHEFILKNRQEIVEKEQRPFLEKILIKSFVFGASHRSLLNIGGGLKNFAFKLTGNKIWGPKRVFPEFAKESFSKQYVKQQKRK